MPASLSPPVAPHLLALADAAAIAGFAVIGIVSHTGTVSLVGLAEDAVPLLAGWFAAALAFRLYALMTTRALVSTWAVGIPLGVVVRAAALGRLGQSRQLVFLATTLVLVAAFLVVARVSLSLIRRQ